MTDLKARFNQWYSDDKVSFFLGDYVADPEQARFLLLKVIDQAVRDYVSLFQSEDKNDINTWQEAKDFLFDDDYYIEWGDLELNLKEALTMLNLDLSYFRKAIERKFGLKNG